MAFSSFVSFALPTKSDEKHLLSGMKSAPWRSRRSTSDCDQCLSESEVSSTDAGEDITPTYVDFTDCMSSTSDSEVSDGGTSMSPRSPSASLTTCVYSMMMLLRLRASVCEEDDLDGVRYSAKAASDLPAFVATPPKAKPSTPKAQAGTSDDQLWWRQTAQALPESSADSWVVQQKSRNLAADESVTRSARSILNKLTVEKFESLFDQLATCGIEQPHHISILMREVFEKATTQHHFIPMYAELCVKLEKDPRIMSVVEEAGQFAFRRLLLNECQRVFEQLLESHIGDQAEDEEDEEAVFRRKQQALGNMKLIGQLLVQGMLSSDLFVECCEELLRKRAQFPEALESLVALMMVAGPKFDKSSWQYYQRLQKILTDMGCITKDKTVAPRLRFLIRDVLDAREAGWPHSPSGGKAVGMSPAKLEDVRIAAEASQCGGSEQCREDTEVSPKGSRQQDIAKAAPWNTKKLAEHAKKPESETSPAKAPEGFQVVAFRRTIATIFNDLASDRNIPAAVQKVRLQQVPAAFQAEQYVDILSRIVEERRGAVRRCNLAFIAGLAAAESSAFDRKECLAGIQLFFRDVYTEMCNEVHRLPAIMKSEFMPTMLTVFPAADLNAVVPGSMRK